MQFHRLPSVLTAFAGVGGGLFLTLLSGLHVVKPLGMDAPIFSETIYVGFPFSWLEATRTRLIMGPWRYNFIWQNFVADFVIYGLLASGVIYLYFTKRGHSSL